MIIFALIFQKKNWRWGNRKEPKPRMAEVGAPLRAQNLQSTSKLRKTVLNISPSHNRKKLKKTFRKNSVSHGAENTNWLFVT